MFQNKDFNFIQLNNIDALLAEEKEEYLVDLHIHTSYSADGLPSVEQAIQRAKYKNFDIISITDHDSIGAYDDIMKLGITDNKDIPVIIPGVEFSVSYPEYEERCHVLKYFFDTDDTGFQENVEQNNKAYWNRIFLQFQRIQENQSLQYFFNKYKINYSVEAYRQFLENSVVHIPEYPTLMDYLYLLLSQKGIFVWDVFEKVVEDNEQDLCQKRKVKKRESLKRFYEKNIYKDINKSGRKLSPILAPVGIDDAEFECSISSGSLSVNEYGQNPIRKLINSGINILAHPSGTKLACIDGLTDVLSGLELNIRSEAWLNEAVEDKARNLGLLISKGSDTHSDLNALYDDLSFYKISYKDLYRFAQSAKRSLMKLSNGRAAC